MKESMRNEAYARYIENSRVVRSSDNEEAKRCLSEIAAKVDSLSQTIEKRLTEGKDSSESTLKELENSLLTKITELDEKQSQITDALESIAGLIKEQSKKETRNQEVQTEKVITVTVDTKNRKRKSSDHNRTFHHTCSEKKQVTSHRLRSNSTSASTSKKPRTNLRMQFQRRRLAEMTNQSRSRMATRSSPRIERNRGPVEVFNNSKSILSSSSESEQSVQEISGYVNHHSTPLKPVSPESNQTFTLTRRTPKRYIEFTSESDTE